MKAKTAHSNSEISTITTTTPSSWESDPDANQLFFVTSYSDFDKLGKSL
jgi:hypothetical protein